MIKTEVKTEYKAFCSVNPATITSFLNKHVAQGWKLEQFAVGPRPRQDPSDGAFVGTESEAWVLISRQIFPQQEVAA